MATTAARNEPFTRALGLSVLFHALVLTLAASPLVRQTLGAWQAVAASSVRVQAPVTAPQEIEVLVPQITVVTPPSPPQSFIHTDGLTETAPPPPGRFISDHNTRAASELPPDPQGTQGLPSQQGVDIPVVEVIRSPLSESEQDDGPTPLDRVTESPAPPAAPAPIAPPTRPHQPADDQLALKPPPPPLDLEKIATTPGGDDSVHTQDVPVQPKASREPPRTASTKSDLIPRNLRESVPEARETREEQAETKRPPATQVAPATRFSGLREPTRQHGTITNRGPASVDAADTPIGRYMKEVTSAIEREWHRKRRSHADWVTYGTIKLEFSVNRQGQVQSLAIKNRNGANAVMQDFTLNAVLDAKIPPMPPGLPEIFDHERLPISYDIIVY